MPKIKIEFGAAMVLAQEYGAGADEHTRVAVVYAVVVDGQFRGIYASVVKQVVGSTFEDRIFEATAPEGYDGPWDYSQFTRAAGEYYYSECFSGAKAVIDKGPPALLTVSNAVITTRRSFEFEVP